MADYADDSRARAEHARKRQMLNDLISDIMHSINLERDDGREEASYRLSSAEKEVSEDAVEYLNERDYQTTLEDGRLLISWVLDDHEKAEISKRKRGNDFHQRITGSIREASSYQDKSITLRISEDELEFLDDEISHLHERDYSVSFDEANSKLSISWED